MVNLILEEPIIDQNHIGLQLVLSVEYLKIVQSFKLINRNALRYVESFII